MKNSILIVTLAAGIFSARGQQTQPVPATVPAAPSAVPAPTPQQPPPGLQIPQPQQVPRVQPQVPPSQPQFRQRYLQTNTLPVPRPRPPGLAGSYIETNRPHMLLTNLSAFGTNPPAELRIGSDQTTTNATNVVSGTNTLSTTNSTSGRDVAATPADQRLIIEIRRALEVTVATGRPWAPVQLVVNRGVVMVVGVVPELQQKQQMFSVIRRIPGVIQVVDNLQVSMGSDAIGLPAAQSAESAPSAAQAMNVTQDQASTAADQNLVTSLHQAILPVIGNAGPWAPIHFVSRDGVVTVGGYVPNETQRQQVVALVQQTPGVVRVIDRLQINIQAGVPGTAVSSPSANSSAGGAASQAPMSETPTNLAPTGRTNVPQRTY